MRSVLKVLILAALCLASTSVALAATEVKMTGDVLTYGMYAPNKNFTGWNTGYWTSSGYVRPGTQTEEQFEIWERFRLRSDFVASEAVKFRLGLKVEDTWGHGTYTAANPSAGITTTSGSSVTSGVQDYLAYLQFKVPNTDIQVTAGLQPLSLPGTSFFGSSVVFGGDNATAAAAHISVPVIDDRLSLGFGMARLLDAYQTFNPSSSTKTKHFADECDVYYLLVPITLDGFKATPWAAIASAGLYAGYFTQSAYGTSDMGDNLVSAGALLSSPAWRSQMNAYFWSGTTLEVTACDPIRFYADVVYGQGAMADAQKNHRQGWFIDLGAEYTGLDMVTPQVFGWWSTGEDGSTRNGSERMPIAVSGWGPGNSFLFDSTQEFTIDSNMGVNPVGAYGAGASLNNISFIEKLTQRLTFTYLRGNNSPRAIRYLNLTLGDNPYFMMGRDLTTNEQLFSINLDSTYKIYENLSAIVETGWAHGDFQESVWGHRWVKKSNDGDAWKVAFGLKYTF